MPVKPAGGVYVHCGVGVEAVVSQFTVPPLTLVVSNVFTVSTSPSASVSLASTSMSTGVSNGVLAASSTAKGASLTALTVIVTVAEFDTSIPSEAL